MPYKFKNDGSDMIKPREKKIYLLLGLMFVTKPFVYYYLNIGVDVFDIFGAVMGSLIIWGTWFNGFYKVARYLTEQKMRRDDNKWR